MSTVMVEQIPASCTVDDVCKHLRMSRWSFYQQKARLQELGVLVERLPRLGSRRPIYLGAPIAKFLSTDGQTAQIRRALRQA